MKKLLTAGILLAVIVGFCTWSTWRVNRICRDAALLLEQAETRCALGDHAGACEKANSAQRLWDCHEGFLGLALRHTESDDVSIQFPPLLESCRQRDSEEFVRRNLELQAMLKHLSRMEIPYYFNIL